MTSHSRRRFLVTTGLSAAMLPMMARSTFAQTKTPARRFMVMVVPNGVTPNWFPVSGVANQGLRFKPGASSPLAPLEALKDKVIVLNHMTMDNGVNSQGYPTVDGSRAANNGRGEVGGHSCSPLVLTAHAALPGPTQPDGWQITAGGPSIDVYLGDNMPGAKNLKFRSLALRTTRHGGRGVISYRQQAGGTAALGVEDDPPALFKKLFEGGDLSSADAERVAKGELNILDRVTRHLGAMRNHFGFENMARIDAHLESVQELSRSVAVVNSCKGPTLPGGKIDWTNSKFNPDFPLIAKTQMDMIVNAFACDLTRSASLMMSDYANGSLGFGFLRDKNSAFGAQRDHHGIAHDDSNGQKGIKDFVDQWFIEQYAYMLDRLSKTLDADGRPLIETTVVVFATMQDTGVGHAPRNLGWIMGGNFDGYFKTGRYLEFPGGKANQQTPTAQLFTSIINGSGAPPIDYFGDDFGNPRTELSALLG